MNTISYRYIKIHKSLEISKGNVGMFDWIMFDNSFDLVQQLKNRSFSGHFFVHVTGRNKN